MFFNIFCKLCQSKGMSANGVAKELSIASGTVSEWKKGRIPQNSTLLKIADYFGVTVDYLLGKESAPTKKDPGNISAVMSGSVHMIPVFESVSAGFGAMAQEYIVDYYPCFIKSATEAAETIIIKVKGDSMYPKIEDGDLIQVHKQESVDSGAIAVVLVDGDEGYVKKVVYGEDWIELHSINPMYPVMRFKGPDALRIRIIGLVRKVIKDI